MWDGRFAKKPDELAAEFSESISYDQRLYKHDIIASQAHVNMLAEQKIIPKKDAQVIKKELSLILEKIENGRFEFKTELEDIHMNIEAALIEKLGDTGARVHSARSRNDQVATDIRLYLKEEIDNFLINITELQCALMNTADKNKTVIMPGFTHLQYAQPILFAHHLLAYIEKLERDKDRLKDCKKRMNVLPLGSAALAGTTLPLNRQSVADQLGFDSLSRNSMDAISDRDFAMELLSDISIMFTHFSRLAEDLILWSSSEFNYIELDDAFCTGSSIMPQKKNPDMAELIRGKTGRIYGNLFGLFTVMKGLPMTYNRDMQEDKEKIFDSIDTVKITLPLLAGMINTMQINNEKLKKAISDPYLMATDLAEWLVSEGVPFRTAHHRVGSLIKDCAEKNLSPDKISLEQMKISVPEAKKECLELFSAQKSIESRNIFGGTAYKQVEKQLNFWKNKVACPRNIEPPI